jgi:hypothetical protein
MKGRFHFSAGAGCALGAAALFGASTPAAKLLIGQLPPVLLAGLLYLGSGVGLGIWWLTRKRTEALLRRAARGGRMCGANAPACEWVRMGGWRSARCGCGWKPCRAPE